jgi:DNA-binding transcriptional ArsR family regulator
MTSPSSHLDDVFQALGDPTRRAVLARLCKGPASVSDLAAPFRMALPSFVQHLRVLEDSGLIYSTKKGRVRTCHAKPQPLKGAESWIAAQRTMWEQRLDRFDAYVTQLYKDKDKDND